MKWIMLFKIFLFAVFFSIIFLFIFKKLKILDKPGPDVPKRKRVPNLQGIVLFIGFWLSLFLFYNDAFWSTSILSLFFATLLLIGVYLLDDFLEIPPWFRLLVQIVAASIVFWY